MTTRRTFLHLGLGSAVVLALGGVGLALRGTVHRAPARPLLALSPRAFSVLVAVADTILDYDDALPAPSELGVAEGVDAHLAGQHPAVTAEIEQVLMLLENAAAGLVLDGRVTTFTGSSPAVRAQVLSGWASGSLPLFRTAYRALHGLCNGVYWSDPAIYAAIGYPGPPSLAGAPTPHASEGSP